MDHTNGWSKLISRTSGNFKLMLECRLHKAVTDALYKFEININSVDSTP